MGPIGARSEQSCNLLVGETSLKTMLAAWVCITANMAPANELTWSGTVSSTRSSQLANDISKESELDGQVQETLAYRRAVQQAVLDGDASRLEPFVSWSGADAASSRCYLSSALDGKQPGGCPTPHHRDTSSSINDAQLHVLRLAIEVGSGIVPQQLNQLTIKKRVT